MPKIQLRHDTSTNWTTYNPILLEGEIGIETDTNKMKIGDGVTAYNSLEYFGGDIDLSDYYDKTEVDGLLNGKQDVIVAEVPINLVQTPNPLVNLQYTQDDTGLYSSVQDNTQYIDFNTPLAYLRTYKPTATSMDTESFYNAGYIEIPYNDKKTYITTKRTPSRQGACGIPIVFGKYVNNEFIPVFFVGVADGGGNYSKYVVNTTDSVSYQQQGDYWYANQSLYRNDIRDNSFINGSNFNYDVALSLSFDNSQNTALISLLNNYADNWEVKYADVTISDSAQVEALKSITTVRFCVGRYFGVNSTYPITLDNIGVYNGYYTRSQLGNMRDIADYGTNEIDLSVKNKLSLSIGSGLTIQNNNLVNTNPTAPSVMTGATSSTAGTSGLVPAPQAGDDTKFLSGDGTYKTVTTDLSNYIQKTDVAYPTIYGSKTPVTVNSNTGVIRINPVGNLSTPTYFPDVDIQNGTIIIPTTAKGNGKLDRNQVLGYYGDIVDTNITFPNQFVHNNGALTYIIIGHLDESTSSFFPGLVCTNDNLYSFELVQNGSMVSNGVTCTAFRGVFSPFTSTTSSSEQTNNSMEIREGANNTLDIATVLKQASGSPAEELVYSVTISNAFYNCVIFGLSTLNNKYYYNDFVITNTSDTEIWRPTPTTTQSYLNISIGSGLTVASSGQLAVSPDRVIGTGITNITKLTQAEYDALATKDASTFYVIVADSNS